MKKPRGKILIHQSINQSSADLEFLKVHLNPVEGVREIPFSYLHNLPSDPDQQLSAVRFKPGQKR